MMVNTYTVEDKNGNVVSPVVVVEDSERRQYKIVDCYITGEDKFLIKLEEV